VVWTRTTAQEENFIQAKETCRSRERVLVTNGVVALAVRRTHHPRPLRVQSPHQSNKYKVGTPLLLFHFKDQNWLTHSFFFFFSVC
jgi:hypothetical protein